MRSVTLYPRTYRETGCIVAAIVADFAKPLTPPYRRKYPARRDRRIRRPAQNIGRRCGAPADKSCILFSRGRCFHLTFTGRGRFVIYLTQMSECVCVRDSPRDGGVDPCLARFTLALGIICITATEPAKRPRMNLHIFFRDARNLMILIVFLSHRFVGFN